MMLFLNEWLEALLRSATELQNDFPEVALKRPKSWHQLRSHASDVGSGRYCSYVVVEEDDRRGCCMTSAAEKNRRGS